jgi:hypothetical protein
MFFMFFIFLYKNKEGAVDGSYNFPSSTLSCFPFLFKMTTTALVSCSALSPLHYKKLFSGQGKFGL